MSDPHGATRVLDPPRHDGEPRDPGVSRPPLSCDRIVDAALRLVDRECLADLSMRRLGGELGVEAMSLYRYFPSKSALLDGVVCRALEGLALPDAPPGSDWVAQLTAYAPLMATLGPEHSTLSRAHARMVELWVGAGMDARAASQAQGALHGYLVGSSFWGAACGFEPCATEPSGHAGRGVSDADFEFGLAALIDGLRARAVVADTAR
jgi:AcrR family transcriptional regulator